jgi:hypothetical protein
MATVAALVAVAQLAIPSGASGAINDGKNEATRDYLHGPLPPTAPGKAYDKNAATGGYAPAKNSADQPARLADHSGFDWEDAATGAGAMLALVLALVAGALVVRPRVDCQAVTQLSRPPERRVAPVEFIRVRR